jgi:23S rRNA (cytosine1962-C5)-methyltransferase
LALEPSQSLSSVYLAKPMLHPSVFRKRIDRIEGNPGMGDYVSVYSTEGASTPQLFAYGLYNGDSEITVRLVSWWSQIPDTRYWDGLLDRAVSLRHDVLGLKQRTDAYRLIHAEADGFPGLAVDRYGDVLSAEVFSVGMYQRAVDVLNRLGSRCGTKHHLIQASPMFLSQEGMDAGSIRSPELPASATIQEQGTRFRIHFETGHKTGFFCDQRANRLRLAELCRDQSVLDLCCYTGGFSIQAARLGKAREVTGVDLDEQPLAMARKNADLNQVRVKFAQADAFAYMRDMLRLGRTYDVVVLDPPKLIRNRGELEEGSKKHFDLNRLALQLVRPGGLMLTCSCAGLLPMEEFHQMIRSAAKSTGYDESGQLRPPRTVQILSRSSAAEDHPVVAHCPETDYLKSMWLRLW